MINLLDGVHVLDLSRLIPGAYATAKLADMGADVVKLEQPPRGDYLRLLPPTKGGVGLLYMNLNRNKRSVAVDLSSDEGYRTFESLVDWADVVVDGARPGASKRNRTDYESVRALKPNIIYCALSAYGQDGPYAQLPAHGAQMEATAGFIQLDENGPANQQIPNIRVFNATQAGGTHAALAIVSAMLRRERTGEGAFLDISCWDGAVSWLYGNLTTLANNGEEFAGSEGFGPRYGAYRASDGGWLTIGLIEPKFWIQFCEAIERPDLATRVDRTAAADYGESDEGLREELVAIFAARSQSEWVRIASERGLPLAPVVTPRQLLDNEHTRARHMLASTTHPETGEPVTVVALPIKVAGCEFSVDRPAPRLGEHTDEVLAEISARQQ